MRRSLVALFVIAAFDTLAAQPAPPRPGVIAGIVHDSIGGSAMRGAEVSLDPASGIGTPRSTTTDAAGAFHFDSVSAGDYAIGFSHPSLDSLGVGTSMGAVHVAAGETTSVRLSTPSLPTIVRRVCADRAPKAIGALVGRVRDGESGVATAARVTVQWSELVAEGRRATTRLHTRSARTREDGAYTVCDVPNDVAVTVEALADDGDRVREGQSIVDLHDRALTVHDIAVAPVAAPGDAATGSATLALVVRGANGELVSVAHASTGTRAAVADDSGRVRLARLPAGSQVVSVRALGYEPVTVSMRLRADATTDTAVTLQRTAVTQLELVRVTARSAIALDRTGFELRRAQGGFGHFVTADEIQRRQVTALSQVLRSVPGVHLVPLRQGIGYAVMSRRGLMGPNTARAVGGATGSGGATIGECPMTIFVDGVKMFDGFSHVDDLIDAPNVRGIEVYAGHASVPARYTDGERACGVVLIWTR